MKKVISFDIGTGSVKASLWDEQTNCLAETVVDYDSKRSADGVRCEQSPKIWWDCVDKAAKKLLSGRNDLADVVGISTSGHSIGVVPVDKEGKLLLDWVPIWCDARATEEVEEFFKTIDYETWYNVTGCGFAPKLYGIFKLMWIKKNLPDVYENANSFLGTKDYVNLVMTGKMATDRCNAGGSGVYSLEKEAYVDEYIAASGIDPLKLPAMMEPHDTLGLLNHDIAASWGLSDNVAVVLGSVDNSCMCLGAGCINPGELYASLGSSAWIAGCSDKTALSFRSGVYTFPHCIKGLYTPGVGINSAGTSLEWVIKTMWKNETNEKPYREVDMFAKKAPIGSEGVMFCPILAGAGDVDLGPNIQGSFIGLTLGTTKEQFARSVLEGISCELRLAFDNLTSKIPLSSDALTVVGGGACSPLWLEIYAGVFGKGMQKTKNVRGAASLGAAALAFVGTGIWKNYEMLNIACRGEEPIIPSKEDVDAYQKVFERYKKVCLMLNNI